MKKYFKLLRIKHYIKNILVFLPLFFSKNLMNKTQLLISTLGFILFSMVCSIVYIINDIKDIESDRNHPVKSKRPLASGEISIKKAFLIIILLLIIFSAIIISCSYFNINLISSLLLLLLYFVLNLAYSFGLKNYPIIDIIILALGFVIRVLFGGTIIDVNISSWLYLTIFSVSFYLGLGKRRNEYINHKNDETRNVFKFYNKDFLDKNMYMCMSLAIAFYALWAKDYENIIVLWTVPVVMIMAMKYSYNIETKGSEGDPTDIIIKDKALISLGIIYIILMLFGIYL